MGRTLEATFSDWEKDHIAQLYFSDEKPDSKICSKFFKISDMEVLKSVFSRKSTGHVVDCTFDIENLGVAPKINTVKTFITKIARYRTPLMCCIRNLFWKIGVWDSVELHKWLDAFNPEIVFFASGDYAFSYNIALEIASNRKIPLVIGCYDDFYIGTKKSANPIYWLNRNILLNAAKRTFQYARCFIGVCDKMTTDYEKLFNRKGHTIYTSTELCQKAIKVEPRIVYTGNLGYGRARQLITIGRALLKISSPNTPKFIDVYSAEIRTEITDKLNEQNGIHFHGKVPFGEVAQIIQSSSLVIHTESFDQRFIQRVAYSVSTKIADCLASGTCILAYGPLDVASIEYLTENNAAFIVSRPEDLEAGIIKVLTDDTLRSDVIERAKTLADKNHSGRAINSKIYAIFNEENNTNYWFSLN